MIPKKLPLLKPSKFPIKILVPELPSSSTLDKGPGFSNTGKFECSQENETSLE